MAKVKEKLEIFDAADPKRTVEEAVQYMIDTWGYDRKVARLEVLRSRKTGPIGDRIVTLEDGTRAMITV
jgi:hypothetical protein